MSENMKKKSGPGGCVRGGRQGVRLAGRAKLLPTRISALFLVLVLLCGLLAGCSGNRGSENVGGSGNGGSENAGGSGNGGSENAGGSGNAGTGSDGVAKGCYVESGIELPEAAVSGADVVVAMLENAEAQLTIITVPYSEDLAAMTSGIMRYVLEGDTWKGEALEGLREIGGMPYKFTYGPDGLLYILAMDPSTEDSANLLARLSADGKLEKLDVDLQGIDFAVGFQVLGEGEYLFSLYDRTLYLKDGKGITIDGTMAYAQDGKVMNFLEGSTSVRVSDLKSGDKLNEIPLESNQGAVAGDGDNWYLLARSGIHRMAVEGNLWETLVDGSRNSMSKASCAPEGLLKLGEEFYAMYQGENGKREIMKYTYDPDMPTEPTQVLSIVTIEENEVLNQAAIEFMKANMDVRVDIRVMRGENSSATVDDFIQLINTEVLAGKGADILILDQMPVNSYIEKGILEDLTDVMDEAVAGGNLAVGIADSYRQDGKIYTMPLRVGIPVWFGREEAVDAALSLEALAARAQAEGTKLLGDGYYSRDVLFKRMYALCEEGLFAENGEMDMDAFRDFLAQMKVVLDASKAGEMSSIGLGGQGDDQYYTTASVLYGEGACELGYAELRDLLDTIMPWEILKQYGGTYSLVDGSFLPSGLVSLNAFSENKETAKQFIASLFSPEIQSVNYPEGFSVNPQVVEKLVDTNDDFLISIEVEGEYLDAQIMDKERLAEFISHFGELKKPIAQDEVFVNMLLDAAAEYFDGTKTVDDALQQIQEKTRLYLAE